MNDLGLLKITTQLKGNVMVKSNGDELIILAVSNIETL